MRPGRGRASQVCIPDIVAFPGILHPDMVSIIVCLLEKCGCIRSQSVHEEERASVFSSSRLFDTRAAYCPVFGLVALALSTDAVKCQLVAVAYRSYVRLKVRGRVID